MDKDVLKKKYFPRVPWGENGPVRRQYRVRAARGEAADVLAALAEREGFTGPGREAVRGGAAACLCAFEQKAAGAAVGMIFGTETAAHWCDIAVEAPAADGWQNLIVRSEEGENLLALAYNEGVLQFRKA